MWYVRNMGAKREDLLHPNKKWLRWKAKTWTKRLLVAPWALGFIIPWMWVSIVTSPSVHTVAIVFSPITGTFLGNEDLCLPQSRGGNKRSALKSPAGSQPCFFWPSKLPIRRAVISATYQHGQLVLWLHEMLLKGWVNTSAGTTEADGHSGRIRSTYMGVRGDLVNTSLTIIPQMLRRVYEFTDGFFF